VIAILLAIALFGAFWLVGLAALVAARADTTDLRIALTGPAVGVSVAALAAFTLSHCGIAADDYGLPLAAVLMVGAATAVWLRRPRIHPAALLIVAISLAGFVVDAIPMFTFGFRWLANGNDDMANYVLSAQQLLHNGLAAPINLAGLLRGTDYSTVLTTMQQHGSRPGSDLLLSFVSAVTGRLPYEVFMPVIFALTMTGVCSVAALAMQNGRRWWTAALAAALLAFSAMAAFGTLQQLIAQVMGLAIAVALLALLLRREVHTTNVPIAALIIIGLLLAGLTLSYVELASTLTPVYVLYVAVLVWRRELTLRTALRLWLGVGLVVVVVLNTYLPAELNFLLSAQVGHGTSVSGNPPLFGYMLMPSALPTALGFETLDVQPTVALLGLAIVVSAGLFLAALFASAWELRKGSAMAVILVVDAALGLFLAVHRADFGLFKLAMYVQPFLAAGLALICTAPIRRLWAPVIVALLGLLFVVELPTDIGYVNASRNPGAVRNLSASDLIPAFRRFVTNTRKTTVVVNDNPVVVKLDAVSAYGHPVYFLSRDVFTTFTGDAEHVLASGDTRASLQALLNRNGPQAETFDLHTGKTAVDNFITSGGAEHALGSRDCALILPTGEQDPFNRWSLPENHHDLRFVGCGAVRDTLAFMTSALGQNFYNPTSYSTVSNYQLQADPEFPGTTMAGAGRYTLFQVLGPTPKMRLVLSYTATYLQTKSRALPPAAVVGTSRTALPVEGDGSARVISAPLDPQIIDGRPYLLLDMGVPARIHYDHRHGLDAIFGTSIPIDTRRLTSYVRDISLISAQQYARLRPPSSISAFPTDLANPDLQYSGVYEDGWISKDSYFVLAGGTRASLVVRATIPPGATGQLEILLNGRRVTTMAADPGALAVNLPVPASSTPRRVDLRFTRAIRLPAPDLRPAAALLTFVGFVPRASN
jgi:hypothetical protein